MFYSRGNFTSTFGQSSGQEELLHHTHKDHVAEKGYASYDLVKAAIDKQWDKLKGLPAWELRKAKPKAGVVRQAKKRRKILFIPPVSWISLICSTRNSPSTSKSAVEASRSEETTPTTTDTKQNLAEQGASASQMATARTLSFRLPGTARKANDAVSARTRVRMSEALRILRLRQKGCLHVWTRLPPSRRPKPWDTNEEPDVPLTKINAVTHWQDLFLEKKLAEVGLKNTGKIPSTDCLYLRPSKIATGHVRVRGRHNSERSRS